MSEARAGWPRSSKSSRAARNSKRVAHTTVFDGVLGRLLIAAGQPEAARERLDIGLALAQDTGMCFYDAGSRAAVPSAHRTGRALAIAIASNEPFLDKDIH